MGNFIFYSSFMEGCAWQISGRDGSEAEMIGMGCGEDGGLKQVAVMMSTFNGARYLEEQIQSIFQQAGVSITLFIRDDGSTDETIPILEGYAARDSATVAYGENLGIGKSFMRLLYSVPDGFDYYAFSDQDDIWERDKLSTAISQLEGIDGCALYASNLELVDAGNHSIGMRFDREMVFDGSLLSVICRNRCYGCTQVFNRELFSVLRRNRPDEEVLTFGLHDGWVTLSAAACGTVVYDRQSHIRYRRHDSNYTIFDQGKRAIWKKRVSNLLHRYETNGRRIRAREAIRRYPEAVEKDRDRNLIEMLAEHPTIGNRMNLIKNRERLIAFTGESQAWFILKAIVGRGI